MDKTANGVDSEAYRIAADWNRIGNQAVREALDENRRLGVPNVRSINGRVYYELPNGEWSLEDPGVTPPTDVLAAFTLPSADASAAVTPPNVVAD